jgi:hypothetical protein
MNEGTRSGKSTIGLLGISAERPTNGFYLYLYSGADKSLARPGRKQTTTTEDFDFNISYL